MLKRNLRRVKDLIFRIIQICNHEYELLFSQKMKIINPIHYGELIVKLKEKSVERVYFPKIYNLAKESWVDFVYPILEVRKYTDAKVFYGSDFIIINEGAIWDKYFKPQWAKNTPLDKDLLEIKDQYISIKKPKREETVENGLSLCGAHCTEWAHFLVQYLPKLYLLKEIKSVVGHELTIILPNYTDDQIRDIVFPFISQFKNFKFIELYPNEAVNCKTLFYIENTSYLSDHANYINPSDIIIPRFTIESLKNNLVKQFTDNFLTNQSENLTPYRKLYIGRSGYRNILNNEEIENYFVSEGFDVILPHKFSLYEKANIFREASIIVGPYSSGFTNILFCLPGAKALGFINFQRTFDGYVGSFAKYFDVDMMLVTGYDQNDTIHSSYSIPLEKIKSAYIEFIS